MEPHVHILLIYKMLYIYIILKLRCLNEKKILWAGSQYRQYKYSNNPIRDMGRQKKKKKLNILEINNSGNPTPILDYK